MENQTKLNLLYGAIILMIAGYTVNEVISPYTGEPLEPTHYSESLGIKMYCARTTAQYCFPSLETRRGSKRSLEGWKEIPNPITPTVSRSGNRFVCDKTECITN